MRGLYTDWAAPFLHGFRNPYGHREIVRDDYLDAVLMLSALMWSRHNGEAVLYTDHTGLSYYRGRSLLQVFDEVDVELLNGIDTQRFAPATYWAYAKLLVFWQESRSSVQLDTDLIVWKDLSVALKNAEMLAIHPESLSDQDFAFYYKQPFPQRPGYVLNPDWNLEADPINTALLYIADQGFVDYWYAEIERYASDNGDPGADLDRAMLFVDQQLLGICLDARGIRRRYVFGDVKQIGENDLITHLWLYKRKLNANDALRTDFTERVVRCINAEFPDLQLPSWMLCYL